MKFSILSVAATLGLASAQYAYVENHCDETVYVESFPSDDHAPGVLYTIKPGQVFEEAFRYYGTTVKISKTKNFYDVLQYGYSFSNDRGIAYYELSNQNGNPWADKHNTLGAGNGCPAFDCKANDKDCYSQNAETVLQCPQPVNITAQICV